MRRALNISLNSKDEGKPNNGVSRQASSQELKRQSDKSEGEDTDTEKLEQDEEGEDGEIEQNKDKHNHEGSNKGKLANIKDEYDLVGFLLTCKKICAYQD